MTTWLTIGELAQASGLSAHTLRFYEQAGILRPARRRENGHRVYGPEEVTWLAFVLRLKTTGMPLADIRRYAAFRAEGKATMGERLSLLEQHRALLVSRLAELNHCAAALDDKIAWYQAALADDAATSERTHDEPLHPQPKPKP